MHAAAEAWYDKYGKKHFQIFSTCGWNASTTDPQAMVVQVKFNDADAWDNVCMMPHRLNTLAEFDMIFEVAEKLAERWAKMGYITRVRNITDVVQGR